MPLANRIERRRLFLPIIALMVLPKPPVHSSRRRAQLNRLSFALAEQGLFVDARATQGQRIAVRRWHQRVQPY